MASRSAVLVALAAMGVAACSRAAEAPPPSRTPPPPTNSPAPSDTPRPTPAATFTLRPTETDIPTRTPAPCPPPAAEVAVPPIGDVLDYGEALLGYLGAGGSIERVAESAVELHLLGDLGVQQAYAQPDLDGDGVPEVVISLVQWFEPRAPGKVYAAICRNGRYRLAYASSEDTYYTTSQIEAVLDMTGDGLDDLVIRRTGCGAHTCFSWVEILAWDGHKLRDLMDPAYFDLPSTGIQIFGPMPNGSYMIVMTGNSVASVGAGPYHRREVTWELQNGMFRAVAVRFLPSKYRIHFVHDGDRSFALGNYPLALEYYNRVIHDRTLEDWPGTGMAPDLAADRPVQLAAYARFRRVLTRLRMDDFESARVHYQDLVASHPQGDPGAGFSRMGQIFWEEYSASRDFDSACAAAQRFAEAKPAEVLEPLDYGYSNPSYAPAGLCPAAP